MYVIICCSLCSWHCNLKHNSHGLCWDRKVIVKLYSQQVGCSLVPRPLPSFVLWFAFSVIHEAEDSEWGRPDLIHHVSDVRWARGGREVHVRGRGPTAKTMHWIIHSSALPQTLAWSKLLIFAGKKLTFGVHSLHIWISAPPPTSTPRLLMWWMRPDLPRF